MEVIKKENFIDRYRVDNRYHRFLLLSTANLEEQKEDDFPLTK